MRCYQCQKSSDYINGHEHEKNGILLIQRPKQWSTVVTRPQACVRRTDLSGVAQPAASAACMRRYRELSSQETSVLLASMTPAVEFRINSSEGPYVIS